MAFIDKQKYNQGETMTVFTGPIGGSSIIIYKNGASGFILASAIGDDPLSIDLTAALFPLGQYTIVNTREANGCQLLTMSQCIGDPGFIQKDSFKVE